jgi:hypothetical protein
LSLAWYIALERNIPGLDHRVDGKALAHASNVLDGIARQAGVEPLMSFFSICPSDLPEELQILNLGKNAKLAEKLTEKWFSADEGLKTIHALLAAAQSNGLEERILEDLQNFHRVLKTASQHGIRWHLAIDY